MDFDRNAIGSLEDVRREWDSLENERAKVEDRLRRFDAAARGRGGGPGGWRGRGVGGVRDMGNGFGGRGGGGGEWTRGSARENLNSSSSNNNNGISNGHQEAPRQKSFQVSREKYRAMAGTWERGLDPEKDLVDDEPSPQTEGRLGRSSGGTGGGGGGSRVGGSRVGNREAIAAYQRPSENDITLRAGPRGRDTDGGAAMMRLGAGGGGSGGGIRGDRSGGMRGDRGVLRGDRDGVRGDRVTARGDFDRFRNGGAGRGSGEHDHRGGGRVARAGRVGGTVGVGSGVGSGVGGGEPDAKRPRVTSTIVIAGDEHTQSGDGAAGGENRVLDRWNADPAPAGVEVEEAAPTAAEPVAAAATHDHENDDDDYNVDYEPEIEADVEGEGGGSGGGAMLMDGGEADGNGEEGAGGKEEERRPAGKIIVVSGGGPRGRAARVGGVAGSGGSGFRGSLASRLGPPMGRPVMVKPPPEEGGGDGGFVPLAERPMPEPSKPELHPAYKDGDTTKRNRRMFGGLMAHLGRARQQLDHDKTLIQRQNSVAEMAIIRQQQEKRRQRLSAAAAAREHRDEELHKRDFINGRQEKTIIALRGNAFITNQEQLKGHMFTKTLPKLAWNPNEHTDVTQALLAASDKEIDASIAERREADDRDFQRIDDSVAEKAAARARRRQGAGAGEQRGRPDRDANPYGKGNEGRWPTVGAEEGNGDAEGPGLSGTRRKRGNDGADGGGSGDRDMSPVGPVDAAAGDDLEHPAVAVAGPEGEDVGDVDGKEALAVAAAAGDASAAAADGMEVDQNGVAGGGEELDVDADRSAEIGNGGEPEASPSGSPEPPPAGADNANGVNAEADDGSGDGGGHAEGGAAGARGGGDDHRGGIGGETLGVAAHGQKRGGGEERKEAAGYKGGDKQKGDGQGRASTGKGRYQPSRRPSRSSSSSSSGGGGGRSRK